MLEARERERQWRSGQARRPNSRRHQESLSAGERRRLTQLVVCLLLFGLVFIGRGAPEGRIHMLGQTLSNLVHQDTDFRAAFSHVGKAISDGEPFVETFGVLWSEVFGDGAKEQTPPVEGTGQEGAGDTPQEAPPTEEGSTAPPQETPPQETSQQTNAAPPAAAPPQETAAPAPGNALVNEETVTPVMGVLTSPFGYRTNPIDGQWKQHDGIDIMANEGTPIRAFAAGEVDFIGRSPSYGLYLQIKHNNGITSFYAHCSELLVKKGQKIALGETVALVGSTGDVTGAHLHLEMKQDGKRIDPLPYVETITQ